MLSAVIGKLVLLHVKMLRWVYYIYIRVIGFERSVPTKKLRGNSLRHLSRSLSVISFLVKETLRSIPSLRNLYSAIPASGYITILNACFGLLFGLILLGRLGRSSHVHITGLSTALKLAITSD